MSQLPKDKGPGIQPSKSNDHRSYGNSHLHKTILHCFMIRQRTRKSILPFVQGKHWLLLFGNTRQADSLELKLLRQEPSCKFNMGLLPQAKVFLHFTSKAKEQTRCKERAASSNMLSAVAIHTAGPRTRDWEWEMKALTFRPLL